jgi:hypothetical protein
MKIIVPLWLARAVIWSNATKLRFILIFGVCCWGGGMIAWNIHEIWGAPTIWLGLAQIGLLTIGGVIWAWLMWFVVKAIRRKSAKPPNSN